MNTRKGMKTILIGAAVILLVATINASADRENEEPTLMVTSVEADTTTDNPTITHYQEEPTLYDADSEEKEVRADTLEQEEKLGITPIAGADEDILVDTGFQAESENSHDVFPISFPVFTAFVFLGLLGCIIIYGKKQE